MWHIINALYEDYCQARLDEMLKLGAVNQASSDRRRRMV
jgi:hypothetical protein